MNTAVQGEIAATGADNTAADIALRGNALGLQAADLDMRAAGAGMDVAGNMANMGASRVGQTMALEADARDKGFAGEMTAAQILSQTPTLQRSLRMQNDATQTAKKMDIAGMYRGLTGASQGAYSMAMGAGNSANSNNGMAGQALMQNMNSANGLQMSGRQLAMNGLTNILNNQTSYANANQGESFGSILGGLGGAAAGAVKLYKAFPSDRRLKVGVELVGKDDRTGLNLYEFSYKWAPEYRYRGVMADEVLKVNPDAVQTGEDGFMRVNYGLLGLEMTEA
jgi:hypothetical protein